MTSFLHNNDFSVVYSDRRATQLVSAVDAYWLDSNACIDAIRNTLFSAGWDFVNPLATFALGTAVLKEAYHPGDGFLSLDMSAPGFKSIPHKEDGGGNVTAIMRCLLVAFSSDPPRTQKRGIYLILADSSDQTASLIALGKIPPIPPTAFRVSVYPDGGDDFTLPAGYTLPQVRGLPAFRESALTVGSYAGSGIPYSWFADRAGTAHGHCWITGPPGPNNGCLVETGPVSLTGEIISGGIANWLNAQNGVFIDSWKFRQEHPDEEGAGSYPDSDTFHAIDFVTTVGRDSALRLIDFTNDMTGTIGNNALLHFDYYTAGPNFTAYSMPDNLGITNGGGWVMANPGGEITVAIRQSLDTAGSVHFDAIEFLFPDSRSSILFSPFFYGRPVNAVSYRLYAARSDLGRLGSITPQYRVIANSHGFVIIDDANGHGPTPAVLANNCLLAVAPRLAQEQLDGGATKSVLVAGPDNLNHGCAWDQTFSVSLDGSDYTTSTALSTTRAGICTAAFGFNYPLRTSNARVFIQNAWAMAPPGGRDGPESIILGRVPDALVLTGDAPQGDSFSFDGHTFFCIATQGPGTGTGGLDRPVCSLWMAAD